MKRIFAKTKKFIKKSGEEKGQALVEFALILPVFLLLACGILDFGWIYSNQYKVEQAAFTGARYAALHAESQTPSELQGNVEDKVLNSLDTKGQEASVEVSMGENSVSVTVSYPVRTLTFVANTLFGNYYNASFTSVSSF